MFIKRYKNPIVAAFFLSTLISGMLFLFFVRPKTDSPLYVTKNSPKQEYSLLREEFLKIVNARDPRAAIDTLKTRTRTDRRALDYCHELLHEIGRASFTKYHDFAKAMSYNDEFCVSGYMHGIIEAYFKNSNDLLSSITSVCASYKNGTYSNWECHHGIGHGLMFYTDNNVPLSLSRCRVLSGDFAKSACANGVYMENFNADTANHPTRYISSTDPYFPCDAIPMFQSDCYMNAPIHYLAVHSKRYSDAFDWCDRSDPVYKRHCFKGLTSQITRRHMDEPAYAERLCKKYAGSMMGPCIDGIITWYMGYYADYTSAAETCGKLDSEYFTACQKIVANYKSLF